MRRRVFFDTNVWVSAIVFPGLCAELLLAALRAEADLFVTGDARLLEWERREALLIVSPRQAWGLLQAAPS